MDCFVVVATKGRPGETGILIDRLAQQTLQARKIIVVGTEPGDIGTIPEHELAKSGTLETHLSDRPGLTIQRNFGIDRLIESGLLGGDADPGFVVFYDDDFRPHPSWQEEARDAFLAETGLAGLTGRILADGVRSGGLSEDEATRYLDGSLPPQEHWASGPARVLTSMYGCNMAFRNTVFAEARFDERLPLYGWQEDRDFTSQAAKVGECKLWPDCKGVHLGVYGGRGSGVRLGYSQVANVLYLRKKRTFGRGATLKFIGRSLAANTLKGFKRDSLFDYRGRLKGNLMALGDMVRGRMAPERILEL